jgi:hypothetical protein
VVHGAAPEIDHGRDAAHAREGDEIAERRLFRKTHHVEIRPVHFE